MSYDLARRFNDPLLKPYVPANTDAQGFLEAEKNGLKSPMVRDSGRESTYRPRVSDMAPREASWAAPASKASKH